MVVILIIAHKDRLNEHEKSSLKQCYNILNKYPIRVICQKTINTKEYTDIVSNVEFDYIDAQWLSTYAYFNKLKINRILYKRYSKYKFILFYELDAWVFKDELEYWCKQPYDYIGAPWFEGTDDRRPSLVLQGIGNGGFSLRRISAHLKVLNSLSYIRRPSELWENFIKTKTLRSFIAFLLDLTVRNNTFFLFNNYKGHEDRFWGMTASKNFEWFRLPKLEIAQKFSWEDNPSFLFEANNKVLPFGCHAWLKYEPGFWKNFIH